MTLTREPIPTSPTVLPFIGAEAIRQLVSIADAIEASRTGFRADVRGEMTAPLRSSMCDGRILIMPAEHRSGSGVIKVLNPALTAAKGISPGMDGVVLWIDSGSGAVGAILDVATLTAFRTGAASGLATSLLAPRHASVLAMLGSGAQAQDQIEAVCAVRPISEVRVASRRYEPSVLLCERLEQARPGIRCQAVRSAAEAVSGADVVCTATRSNEPLFKLQDLAAEVHINAIGAFQPDMCELPNEVFKVASKVVVDQIGAALAEAGDVINALKSRVLRREQLTEIGDLLESTPLERRGVTIFKSVGIAAQDWSMAELVVHRAREVGLLPT